MAITMIPSLTLYSQTDVSGNITTNTTWDLAGSPYTLTSDINIADSITLTIDPGVEVEGESHRLTVWGFLVANGTEGNKIHFNNLYVAQPQNGPDGAKFRIEIYYAEVDGGNICATNSGGSSSYGTLIVENSIISDNPQIFFQGIVDDCMIRKNIFYNFGGFNVGAIGVAMTFSQNVFMSWTGNYVIENWRAEALAEFLVHQNTFMDTTKTAIRYIHGGTGMTATNNFWNTPLASTIESMIWDKDDDFALSGTIPYSPFLTTPDAGAPVVAEFSAEPDRGIYPLEVRFSDKSAGDISSWVWDFGDGNSSGDQHPTHTYTSEGFYTVSLTISDGSQDDSKVITDLVDVGVPPVAEMILHEESTCPGRSIEFADSSHGDISSLHWAFWGGETGSDSTSADSSVSVLYNHPGIYPVRLIAFNSYTSDTVWSTVTIHSNPVVSVTDSIEICSGDSAMLTASGAETYSWSTIQTGESIWVKPLATQSYSVTGTDAHTCTAEATAKVFVFPTPDAAFSQPASVCGDARITILFSGSAGDTAHFEWDFDGATVHSGTGAGPYEISWGETGEKEISLNITENLCSSDTVRGPVTAYPVPSSSFTAPEAICGTESALLSYTGSSPAGAVYDWKPDGGSIVNGSGQGPVSVSWASGGLKNVELTVTEASGCVSDTTSHIIQVSYPYDGEEICLVSVDEETAKNMVIWEKTEDVGIASYNIYRESSMAGVYEFMASMDAGLLSVYIDSSSIPEKQQYLYKISAVDTCGNESAQSLYHKTLLLQFVSSIGGVNLTWEEYEVEDQAVSFISYIIYRGTDSLSLSPIDTISGNLRAYTDLDPEALSKKYYYRIAGVKTEGCNPSSDFKAGTGPYTHSLSNLDDNKLKTGMDKYSSFLNISVYPNPVQNEAKIRFHNPDLSEHTLYLRDMSGKLVLEINGITNNEVRFRRDGLKSGYYSVEIRGSRVHRGKIIIM